MAKNLNYQLLAEGVETQEQFDFLHDRGCNQIQGFFFSRPLPEDKIQLLLSNPDEISALINRAKGIKHEDE